MTDFLNEQEALIEEYDEQLIKNLIGQIIVFEDSFMLEFKSGVEVEVEV